ncbi:M55 family metallopeptidase [Micromonospora sp. KLBMP9576]|uniref:M55 family metallopeptidase n=1 Tax=Micromonospora sp. KLBMP9576 TaxID=3424769 RepID=UPI003D8FC45F
MAGHLGAPVVLLSGDDTACAEFSELVPSAATVAVNQALAQAACWCGCGPRRRRRPAGRLPRR